MEERRCWGGVAGPKPEADSTVMMGAAAEVVGGVSWRLLLEESLSTWDVRGQGVSAVSSTQRCQSSQQTLLELISLCRTLKRQPKLAVTQAPVMEDGVHLVVNQAWLQGTL